MRGKKIYQNKKIILAICVLFPILILLALKLIVKKLVLIIFLGITAGIYFIGLHFVSQILDILNEFTELIDNIKSVSHQEISFNKINEIINQEKYKYVSRVFKLYKKSLRKIDEVQVTGEIKEVNYSTIDAVEFFDEENVIYKFINYKTLNYITQSLTGIGIFGTFLGIVQGISQLNMDDFEKIKTGINILLSGVKTSFNTSLYGILFSVILTFIVKFVIDYTMKKCGEFCEILDDTLIKSTDKEGFKEIEYELQKQTTTLEQLATSIIDEMGKKFNESIEENLLNLTKTMEVILNEMSQKISDSNMLSAQTIGNTIIPAVSELQIAIKEMQKEQKNSNENFIESSINSVKEAVNIGIEGEMLKLKDSMIQMSQRNEEMVNAFSMSMDKMQDLAKYQESLIQNTTNSTESMNSTTNNIKDLQEGLLLAIKGMKEINQSSNISVENIQETLSRMKNSMLDQVKINESMELMINKSRDVNMSQSNFISKLNEITKNIEINMENTNSYISSLTSDINIYKNEFNEIKQSTLELIENLEYKYKNIISDLSLANSNLSETVENIQNKLITRVDFMSEGLNKIIINMNDYQTKNEALVDKIEQFAAVEESTQIIWNSYKESFENLNNTITEGVQDYNKHINDGVSTVLNSYDTYVSKAVNDLKIVIEQLGETVEEISDDLETIVGIKEV